MLRTLMKSKVHRATVSEANLHYVGSLTLDRELMDLADLVPNEKVQVVNVTNGERLETYLLEGAPGSGVLCLNGARGTPGASRGHRDRHRVRHVRRAGGTAARAEGRAVPAGQSRHVVV